MLGDLPPSPSPPASDLATTLDVWGTPSPLSRSTSPAHPSSDPSDIPRLRSQHATAGYRDGIVASKEVSMQTGFDEGYALGAAVGLRAGVLVGSVEGLFAAVGPAGGSEKERLRRLQMGVREELSL